MNVDMNKGSQTNCQKWNLPGNNAMEANSGYRFSTHDQDNDGSSNFDCAEKHRGGWWYPDDSNTGSTSNCYSFSNGVATGDYEYSNCVCSDKCEFGRLHYKCYYCDGCGCIFFHCNQNSCCAYKTSVYETNFYSCGYSNLNGDYSFNDNRGIFWKDLYGSDCGITTTIMKILPR
ncbi:hypothetical protein BSL78_16023 [Apostichopus japonicus]|uniref:Fibrinogen C-terminal domain-containing protein n=1 Tax=Stichopus japonicus TaxID=307972 RepID=A0A2G8KGK6_STIJA|nr:hypothetical protein BSL78_16023 [Apostichopus japonicus]